MTKYKRPLEPKDNRTKALIHWCAINIDEWPKGIKGYVNHMGWKMSKSQPKKDFRSLSYSWTVCTKQQWENYRNEIGIENINNFRKADIKKRLNDRKRTLVKWCTENIKEWPEGVTSFANDGCRKMADSFKIYDVDHLPFFSDVVLCTKEEWEEKQPVTIIETKEKKSLFSKIKSFFKG